MVANLSSSNCRLPTFRRMVNIQMLFASRWTTRTSSGPPKDSRANRYINERLNLKSHLLGSVPLEYLSFCVRGKFCHLAQGNRGLIVVKGSDQRRIFENLGLFTINLEVLLHFRDLNDRTLPDHLHDEVHEDHRVQHF
ncbi:hypothetical protein TNCV_991261 [Trichonephila clavipes]|nr:hypothetical protein TNCV_991261 [Trichonephila clavipes]